MYVVWLLPVAFAEPWIVESLEDLSEGPWDVLLRPFRKQADLVLSHREASVCPGNAV